MIELTFEFFCDFFVVESLAYLTAATHGLTDEAEHIKNTMFAEGEKLPAPHPAAVWLQPPPPIKLQEQNWPLLSVASGFFDKAPVGSVGAAAVGSLGVTAVGLVSGAEIIGVGEEEGGNWGDDADLVLDDEFGAAAGNEGINFLSNIKLISTLRRPI